MIRIKTSHQIQNTIKQIHLRWVRDRFFYKNKGKIRKELSLLKQELDLSNTNDFINLIIGNLDTLLAFQKIIGSKAKGRKPGDNAPQLEKDEYQKKKNTFDKIWDSFGYDDFLKILDEKWYVKFRHKYGEWNVFEYLTLLSIDSCPYCNENYVYILKDEDGKKTTCCEMDHFISKADYPYLSCSIFNLIPSCHNCNTIKRDKSLKIINPFIEGYNENGKFIVYFSNNEDTLEPVNQLPIKVKIKEKICNAKSFKDFNHQLEKLFRIKESKELFCLENRYSHHKIELQDLFTRYRNYSKSKIDEITRLILNEKINLDNLGLNEKQKEDLYQKIASTYTKRIKRTILGLPLGAGEKQYPLRKFKEDIIEQLDNTARKMKTEARNKNKSK